MNCREIIEILNKLAPEVMACEWDNPGLIAGRGEKEVKKILLALDATDTVIEEAVSTGTDLLLTHHPLIFKPLKRINDGEFIGRRLIKLIQNDISYYAMHTNFDAAPGCMGDLAADALMLDNRRVLEVMGTTKQEDGKEAEYGIGKTGSLLQPMPLAMLAQFVKKTFEIPFVTVYGEEIQFQSIRKVAICPGAGGSLLKEALKSGAEAYITGDIGHHDGIDSVANGMAVIDAGHFGIEQIFMKFMENYLTERLDGKAEILIAKNAFPNSVF